MKHKMNRLLPVALIVMLFAISCNESVKTSTKEQTEIKTMDSTSRVRNESMDKLEEQTKKVEQSLEKVDEEFKDSN